MLLISCLCWWLGFIVDVEIVAQLGWLCTFIGLFWAIKGWAVTRYYIIPLMLPVFALPLWDPIVPGLQYLTTQVASTWLHWLSIPVYVESHFIRIPEGKISIEDVCAGLRYLLAAMTVVLVYIYLYIKKLKTKVIFLAVVVLVSMAINWIRVFTVILAGHLTNMTHYLVHNHADFGWWLFALTLIPIFWFGNYLVKQEQRQLRNPDNAGPAHAKPDQVIKTQSGLVLEPTERRQIEHRKVSILLSVIIIIIFMPILGISLKYMAKHSAMNIQNRLITPIGLQQWLGPYPLPMTDEFDRLNPTYRDADEQAMATYKYNGQQVQLYFAKYYYQIQGKELLMYNNAPYSVSAWEVMTQAEFNQSMDSGLEIPLKETVLRNKYGKVKVVWYWYSIAGTAVTDELYGKILQLKDILTVQKKGSAVIVIATDVTSDTESARDLINKSIKSMYSSIENSVNVTN